MSGEGGFVERLWNPRKGPYTFFLVGWVSAISLNLWTSWVEARAPAWLLWLLVFGVPLGVLGLLSTKWFLRLLGPPTVSPEGSLVRALPPARGLVVVASQGRGIDSAAFAIRHHAPKLERLWVLVSAAAADSWAALRKALIEEQALTPEQIESIEVSDDALNDPEAIHRKLEERVFDRLPEAFSEAEVLLDLTGGPKPTTAGVLLAGLPPGRRLQLVLPEGKDEHGFATRAGEVVEVVINYKLRKASSA